MSDPNDDKTPATTGEQPTRSDARDVQRARQAAEDDANRIAAGVEKSKARTAARVPKLLASRVMASQAAARIAAAAKK